jgi:hypothetical protein
VSRTDVDSLTFSHRMDALPLWGVSKGRSRKRRHTTDIRWWLNGSAQRRPHTVINTAPAVSDANDLQTTESNYPNAMCALPPATSPARIN